MADLLAASTPRTLAAHVVAGIPDSADAIVRVQAGTKMVPLFFLNGDLDGGGVYVRSFAQALDPERTVYSLPPHGTNGVPALDSIEAMAADYTERIVRAFPNGPYLLGGYCNGGVVAFEIARRLRARNAPVGPVMLVAATAANAPFAALRAIVDAAARAFGQRPARAHRWYLRSLRARAIASRTCAAPRFPPTARSCLARDTASRPRLGLRPASPVAPAHASLPAFAAMTLMLERCMFPALRGPSAPHLGRRRRPAVSGPHDGLGRRRTAARAAPRPRRSLHDRHACWGRSPRERDSSPTACRVRPRALAALARRT